MLGQDIDLILNELVSITINLLKRVPQSRAIC